MFIFNVRYLHFHWLSLHLGVYQDINKDKQSQKENDKSSNN